MADDGEDVSTFPVAVPRQRGDFTLADLPPAPIAGPVLEQPAKRRGVRIFGVFAVVVLLVLAGGLCYVAGTRSLGPLAAAVKPAASRPATPLEASLASLRRQADALISGDTAGWLAAVDPGQGKLRSRYQAMFASLRALGVNRFDYALLPGRSGSAQAGRLEATARIRYCLKANSCTAPGSAGPVLEHRLVLEPVGGRWVITASSTERSEDDFQPVPWDNGGLVFAEGKRVTLAALPAQRKYFTKVLPIAEAAAAVNDKFAALVGNPQQRYRIYLAGAEQWQSWYGGIDDKWVVGYAVPLGEAGMDVVLDMDDLADDGRLLETTVQHELGHVVTIGSVHRREWGEGDMWLKEGIAEYIGWYPQPATASWRRASVRDLVTGPGAPTTIAARAMPTGARQQEGDGFYGLGHFAADCLARKYGQKALFLFVRLYLREEKDLDPAAQTAFGQPWKAVDTSCVAWIRNNV